MLLRKAATVSTPVMEITEADGTWNIKTSTMLKTMELKFKVCVYGREGVSLCRVNIIFSAKYTVISAECASTSSV